LRQARDCAEAFRGRFLDSQQRRRIQAEAIEAYDLLVLTCADLGQAHADEGALHEAAEVAEASRARNLMELLTDETLQPTNAPETVVEEYRRLRRRLRQAERLLRG
jgi:hypothetical protein